MTIVWVRQKFGGKSKCWHALSGDGLEVMCCSTTIKVGRSEFSLTHGPDIWTCLKCRRTALRMSERFPPRKRRRG